MMDAAKILQTDYLDIIYSRRNRAYGSYELRRHYNRRATTALLALLALMLLFIGLPMVLRSSDEIVGQVLPVTGQVALSEFIYEAPIPKPLKTKTTAAKSIAATVKHTVPIVEHNEKVTATEKSPEIETIKEDKIGPVTHTGDKDGTNIANDAKEKGGGAGKGGEISTGGTDYVEIDRTPKNFVEEMPEFPGGYPALMTFISKHLKYPVMALENGIEGRVLIKFVVGVDGSIESAQVLRALGGDCDKEALRVVNAMPRWKPGRQNGHAVKVYFTLPIQFKLQG